MWKRMMDPGCTLDVTRRVISLADRSFQSRLSTSQTDSSHWKATDNRVFLRPKKQKSDPEYRGMAYDMLSYIPDHFRCLPGQPDLPDELCRHQLFLLKVQWSEFQAARQLLWNPL